MLAGIFSHKIKKETENETEARIKKQNEELRRIEEKKGADAVVNFKQEMMEKLEGLDPELSKSLVELTRQIYQNGAKNYCYLNDLTFLKHLEQQIGTKKIEEFKTENVDLIKVNDNAKAYFKNTKGMIISKDSKLFEYYCKFLADAIMTKGKVDNLFDVHRVGMFYIYNEKTKQKELVYKGLDIDNFERRNRPKRFLIDMLIFNASRSDVVTKPMFKSIYNKIDSQRHTYMRDQINDDDWQSPYFLFAVKKEEGEDIEIGQFYDGTENNLVDVWNKKAKKNAEKNADRPERPAPPIPTGRPPPRQTGVLPPSRKVPSLPPPPPRQTSRLPPSRKVPSLPPPPEPEVPPAEVPPEVPTPKVPLPYGYHGSVTDAMKNRQDRSDKIQSVLQKLIPKNIADHDPAFTDKAVETMLVAFYTPLKGYLTRVDDENALLETWLACFFNLKSHLFKTYDDMKLEDKELKRLISQLTYENACTPEKNEPILRAKIEAKYLERFRKDFYNMILHEWNAWVRITRTDRQEIDKLNSLFNYKILGNIQSYPLATMKKHSSYQNSTKIMLKKIREFLKEGIEDFEPYTERYTKWFNVEFYSKSSGVLLHIVESKEPLNETIDSFIGYMKTRNTVENCKLLVKRLPEFKAALGEMLDENDKAKLMNFDNNSILRIIMLDYKINESEKFNDWFCDVGDAAKGELFTKLDLKGKLPDIIDSTGCSNFKVKKNTHEQKIIDDLQDKPLNFMRGQRRRMQQQKAIKQEETAAELAKLLEAENNVKSEISAKAATLMRKMRTTQGRKRATKHY